jgi:hypothetical protein
LQLMRVMGLNKSSEYVAWTITAFVELAIIFMLCLIILYTGGLMVSSSKFFIYCYLLLFGVCVIAFCYMTSTFFSSASIGSVAGVIFFLTTFLPYVVIISLGATLSGMGKFFAVSFQTYQTDVKILNLFVLFSELIPIDSILLFLAAHSPN